MYQRSSGLLCHITSLPGPYGIGDLGDIAYSFVDFLHHANQHVWQVLPLGPAGAGNSPYDSRSSFAGNPLMISIDELMRRGLIDQASFPRESTNQSDTIQFTQVQQKMNTSLRTAYVAFEQQVDSELGRAFDAFRERNAAWLDDFALYQALHKEFGGKPWYRWPQELRSRDSRALENARADLNGEVMFQEFVQFIFDSQWMMLKEYANERGISLMGDVPIYVALNSAEVWANQELFLLDPSGQPTVQAGVPPDLFAKDGQLWGNPVYDWDRMADDGYQWWEQRIRRVLELTDIVRIDHFRGFAAGWQVPASKRTAREGEWVNGPGKPFFQHLEDRMGHLPIIVEDLGVITPDVEQLRDELGYPGMKVLQFAFGDDAENPYLPHNIRENSMVYTGTHDNDTTRGWYESLDDGEQKHVRQYLGANSTTIHRDMLRAAWSSVGVISCAPVQDVLGLGSEARMNIPGLARGNWTWKLTTLTDLRRRAAFLREITDLYGRNNSPLPENQRSL